MKSEFGNSPIELELYDALWCSVGVAIYMAGKCDYVIHISMMLEMEAN